MSQLRRSDRDVLSLWRSVPRSLMQFMDAQSFAVLTQLIECGSSSEVQIFLSNQENLRCLKNLRKTVVKAAKHLRQQNLEALHTLKREFEQAAILLE